MGCLILHRLTHFAGLKHPILRSSEGAKQDKPPHMSSATPAAAFNRATLVALHLKKP
jgi:hypothetical protein